MVLECPHCQEKFETWNKKGLSICCKECDDFYNSSTYIKSLRYWNESWNFKTKLEG
ncbi:hypothetical protein [Lysinibacillus xylanilyticus]|uniref:hypothetical protein n=1 Tax=Lysinibacillus xylanilyticus TaxID=582475 RepID=UPI0012FDB3CE|nr:hypothetical protein [Lysinibacillus xylanilyticus]